MRALLVAGSIATAVLGGVARGEDRELGGRDLCARGVRHRGAAIDLDVKGADLHDVFRLIADTGGVNIVVPDDVTGRVTLRLVHVAWDAAACAVAGVHHLRITVHDSILLVARGSR
jgi:type II secretory pathway component HofQ